MCDCIEAERYNILCVRVAMNNGITEFWLNFDECITRATHQVETTRTNKI